MSVSKNQDQYEIVVGMEVHVELSTKTKIFCGCPTAFGKSPNTQVCPVCLGMPGSLPVLNRTAFEYALRTALALNCSIARKTQFERKNYYYPDLPKNYQISQQRKNLGVNGWLDIRFGEESRKIGINNIHLEEDAGKNIHLELNQGRYSLIDLNRAGIPLIEIVSEPDLRSPGEVLAFMDALKAMLEYIQVSDCNMHEGRLRFEANVSVRPANRREYGVKVEVKNLNSMKSVVKCIEYEAQRQIALLESGGEVLQETHLWDEDCEVSRPMRSKEEAHDYRYFPEPDLVEFDIEDALINSICRELPELPEARRKRFIADYGIPEYDVAVLTASRTIADYYEAAVRSYNNPKAISNWIMTELLRFDIKGEGGIGKFPVKPDDLADLIRLIDQQTISGKMAKEIFKEMIGGGPKPSVIIEKKGLAQITDADTVNELISKALEANPAAVEAFRSGKKQAVGFLVGQIMKSTRGKANPKLVNELLRKKLEA